MKIEKAQNTRVIPPIPGGGSWTFNEEQWVWVANDPVPAQAPDDVRPDAAGTEQAAQATDQE